MIGVSDLAGVLLTAGLLMVAFAASYFFRYRLLKWVGRPTRRRR